MNTQAIRELQAAKVRHDAGEALIHDEHPETDNAAWRLVHGDRAYLLGLVDTQRARIEELESAARAALPIITACFDALGSSFPAEDRVAFDLERLEGSVPKSAMGRAAAYAQVYRDLHKSLQQEAEQDD